MSELSDAEKEKIEKYAKAIKRGTSAPTNDILLKTLGNIGLNTNNKIKAGLNYLADVWPKKSGFPKKSTWSVNTKNRFGELKNLG